MPEEPRINLKPWAHTNQMILVNCVGDRPIPNCGATNLACAAIAFNHEQVAAKKSIPLQLTIEQLDGMDFVKS